jgi:hypothetical protein
MKLHGDAVLALRWPCLRFLLLAGIAGAIVWSVHREAVHANTLQARELELQRDLRAALQRPPEADDDTDYRRISSSGIVGPEQRHRWVAAIEAAVQARQILDLRYEFAPRAPIAVTEAATTGNRSPALASRMSLRMGLLHEEDLLRFLVDLAQATPAILRIQRCNLEPAAEGAWPARLHAECAVDWITLEEKT